MREQDGALLAERDGDDLALLVAEGNPRPLRQIGAVLEEHGGVHVRDGQLLAQHRQRGGMRRVRVEDAVHVGPHAIDPQVKARRGIGHAVALDGMEVVVHQQQVARRDFVQPVAEARRPEGARPLRARRDLPREPGFVLLAGQHAAGQGQLLPRVVVG